jgi:hypothetical protein
MKLLRDKYPTLYQAVRNYPANGSDVVQHRYFWVKRTVEDRPQFSLRHEMTRTDRLPAPLRPEGATRDRPGGLERAVEARTCRRQRRWVR